MDVSDLKSEMGLGKTFEDDGEDIVESLILNGKMCS